MPYDFPASPTVDQIYTPPGGSSYKWNGYGWAQLAAAGGDSDVSDMLVTATDGQTQTLADWMTRDISSRGNAGLYPAVLPFANTAAKHHLVSTEPATHTAAIATFGVSRKAAGSGTFGPAAADVAQWVSAEKLNYLTSDIEGELDTLEVITRQGHKGDTGAIIVDAAKVFTGTGDTGGVSATEFRAAKHDVAGAVTNSMHTLSNFFPSALDPITAGGAYGSYVEARKGTQYSAFHSSILLEGGGPAAWKWLLTGSDARSPNNVFFAVEASAGFSGPGTIYQGYPTDRRVMAYNPANGTWSIRDEAGAFLLALTESQLGAAKFVASSPSAIPAGGNSGIGYIATSAANFGMFFGSGAPTLSVSKGSIYLRSDGTAGSRTYVNTDGSTGWTPLLSESAGSEPPIALGTTAQYWRGDKSWQTLDKAAVGLANVDNTSDANKPVSTAQATANALAVLKAGDTMTGDLIVAKATPAIEIQKSASGQDGTLKFRTGSAAAGLRWQVNSDTVAEGGSNAGSHLTFRRYSDAGALIDTVLTLNRQNASAQFSSTVSARTAAAIPAGGTNGFVMSSTSNFGIMFGSGVPTTSAAKGSHYLRSDGAVGTYTYVNTDGATAWTPLLDVGAGVLKAGDTMTGNLTVAKATPVIEIQKAASGQESSLDFKTGSAAAGMRWRVVTGSGAESGSNAGSDFLIASYTDAGALIGTPISIARSNSIITLAGGVSSSQFISTSSSLNANSTSSARAATAIPAGGIQAFSLSSTATFGIYFGSGVPTVSAAKGSLYLRSDGTSNVTRMYVNTDGAATWTAVNTVA